MNFIFFVTFHNPSPPPPKKKNWGIKYSVCIYCMCIIVLELRIYIICSCIYLDFDIQSCKQLDGDALVNLAEMTTLKRLNMYGLTFYQDVINAIG